MMPTVQQLFLDYAPYVARTLRNLGVAEGDVEDLRQDVFLVVQRKLGAFEARSSVRTWLYSICDRLAADRRRRASFRLERLMDPMPEQSVAAGQIHEIERRRELAPLASILGRIDEHQREVFVLYELEHRKMREVAGIVGCPLQTAYSRLHAARRQVQTALGRGRSWRRAA